MLRVMVQRVLNFFFDWDACDALYLNKHAVQDAAT